MTPVKQLIGFKKVNLNAKETKNVSFTFIRDDFSLVTPDEHRITEPGEFIIMAGHSSKDSDLLKTTITL